MIRLSSKTLSVQGVGGIVGLYFATVMLLRGLRKLWCVQRMGAFGPTWGTQSLPTPLRLARGRSIRYTTRQTRTQQTATRQIAT